MSHPANHTRSQTNKQQVDVPSTVLSGANEGVLPPVPNKPSRQELGKRNFNEVNNPVDRSGEAANGSRKEQRNRNKNIINTPLNNSSSSTISFGALSFETITNESQSDIMNEKQTNPGQSDGLTTGQQQTALLPNLSAADATPNLPEKEMIDVDQASEGSTENEILYYASQQQLMSLVIGVKLSNEVDAQTANKFLRNTRDYLISDPGIGPGITQVSKILPELQKVAPEEKSRDIDNATQDKDKQRKKKDVLGYRLIINVLSRKVYEEVMAMDFHLGNDTLTFTSYQNIRTQRKQANEGTRNRTVQIYNASLEITTSILKPFLRRYGELKENGVYAARRNPYQPNKQTFYATYK
ncbi:uncharacterized protein OCT59_009816 [Rhizophagus irregularis]|uniref:Uncharacterized protein n=1 Tax=Rhizophagus irregularis (strain DAOM 197198w) TaxID=1432141 RepID=A0A015JRP0_RHIIW|nr:hypothetical protein RirG_204750 [Rhizophagus irregularis DAOM 197198w]UZO18503.1 hypothetical protein OCT59_009816 [Rhizophagus irregularis]GBC29205.1 hypothetical protein GLOIN_2v1475602 [Rhizophagus irregularis DAOM 181602=DAOM 197198]CAG8716882.1 3981_t:CDS:1 [Rhizophagus irregularis]